MARSTVVQWNPGIYTQVPELAKLFDMLRKAARGLIFDQQEVAALIPSIQRMPSISGPAQYIELLSILLQLTSCLLYTSDAADES